MAENVMEYLVTDDLTILLALIGATVFLLRNFYKPQPLVHPILLGRQSDVARVRNFRESAVYRNYGTGLMGRFPVRPNKDVQILADLVRSDSDATRTLWNTKISNSGLQDRAAAFGTGVLRKCDLQSEESSVLLLLNDCIEFVIADLALAAHSIPSFTLSEPELLVPFMENHHPSVILTSADMLTSVLELIYEEAAHRHHTVIVVGEPTQKSLSTVASTITVLRWEDVEREGNRVEKIISPAPKSGDIFSVAFYRLDTGILQGVQLSHENMTAGVAGMRGLFPVSQGLSPLDTVVSTFSLSSPYGRAVAYTALYEGSSFATLDSSKHYHPEEKIRNKAFDAQTDIASLRKYSVPPPTVVFARPEHLQHVTDSILSEAKKQSFMFSFAWRHKLASASEGFITRDSLWDRLVFDGARSKLFGEAAGTVRQFIVADGNIPSSILTPARIALSSALVNAFIHPVSAGAILASHPLDLQDTSDANDSSPAHTGPPTVNTEVKLIGISEETMRNGGDPEGALFIRGPAVGKLQTTDDYVNVPGGKDDNWIALGLRAKVQTNGVFKLVA